MSRTFEILELVQQDRDLFQVPPVQKTSPVSASKIKSQISRLDLAEFNRQEILRLVQHVFLLGSGKEGCGARQVVFCGVDAGAGSRLLCAQVGRSLANQAQSQVCVVDATLRTPSCDTLYNVSESDSLAPIGGNGQVERQVTDNLWVVPIHSLPTVGDVPTAEPLRVLIKYLRSKFDYVIISAPPMGSHSEALLFGQMSDGVVLVLEANSTRRVAARKAKVALEMSNIRVLGVALNNRTFPIPEKIYERL
jgi:Mrp family chromosome partitioning ATPase